MSKAVERPVCPWPSRNWKRALVSSAVPKPANCRIVHRPAAVHARVDAARVRELARAGRCARRVRRDVLGGVERLDLHVGDGREAHRALRRLAIASARASRASSSRYRPFHSGGRLSRNARRPSTRSSLANVDGEGLDLEPQAGAQTPTRPRRAWHASPGAAPPALAPPARPRTRLPRPRAARRARRDPRSRDAGRRRLRSCCRGRSAREHAPGRCDAPGAGFRRTRE